MPARRASFPRPQALLSEAESVLGLDGVKMSKSRHNTIELRMSEDETAKLIKKARPTRIVLSLTIRRTALRYPTSSFLQG